MVMRARAQKNITSKEGDQIHSGYEYEVCIYIKDDDSVRLHVNNDGVIDTVDYAARNDMYLEWKFARTSTKRMSVSDLFNRSDK